MCSSPAQFLGDEKKYRACHDDIEQMRGETQLSRADLSDKLAAAAIDDPNWDTLAQQARAQGVEPAFLDAKAVFLANRTMLGKKNSFAVAIYSKGNRSSHKIVIFDLLSARVEAFPIQHGRGEFANKGRDSSSLGCFLGGANYRDVAFNMHGIEGDLNNKACERRLQVHISNVSERKPSQGCLTVARSKWAWYREIAGPVAGGGIICAYDEGRVRSRD